MKRIEWLDTAKYICIFFVILSHLESNTMVLASVYTPFYLAVFFFSSGYVYKHIEFKSFLVKRFHQLFIPWLAFSVFNILLSQIFSFNEHADLKTEMFWNFLQIRGKGDGIWFVSALFAASIPFYFFVQFFTEGTEEKKLHFFALPIAFFLSLISRLYTEFAPSDLLPWNSVGLPWHLEYVFQAMFFMAVGYAFRIQYEVRLSRYRLMQHPLLLGVVYLTVILISPLLTSQLHKVFSVLIDYAKELLGIIFIVSICKTIKPNTYISYIGQNTLILFTLHGKVYSVIQTLLKRSIGDIYDIILGNILYSSVFAMLLTLVITLILIAPVYIINRWLPFLVGRKRARS